LTATGRKEGRWRILNSASHKSSFHNLEVLTQCMCQRESFKFVE
jgi:hypothetical protein